MSKLANLEPGRVLKYFEEICSIPHGSGNMEKISDYCMEFAKKHSLNAVRDEANNVIIYKKATKGHENADARQHGKRQNDGIPVYGGIGQNKSNGIHSITPPRASP